MIYGARLRQVRELAGLTQRELSELAHVPQPRISNTERKDEPLPKGALTEIAAVLQFPIEFFENPPTLELTQPVHFRSQASARAFQIIQARRAGEVLAEHALKLREGLRSPRVRVRQLEGRSPREAAIEVRGQLGLTPHEPLLHLPLLLERTGFMVLGLPLPAFKKDAFSFWVDGLPVLNLLQVDAGDRQAWSAAHEVGHLVMHRGTEPSKEIEDEANDFARHFLLPQDAYADDLAPNPTLQQFALLKRKWGVSIQAQIRAAKDLGVIEPDRYSSLFRQISARGERLRERASIAAIKPRAFHKMAELAYGPAPAPGLAKGARWTAEFAEKVLRCHASVAELPTVNTMPNLPRDESNVTSIFDRRRARA